MRKTAKKTTNKKESVQQHELQLPGIIRDALLETVVSVGMARVMEMFEAERTAACGPRYVRDPKRKASRAGYAPGELVMAGRRVSVQRPRARSADGQEVQLPSWELFSSGDLLTERAVEQMMVGVATRKYGRSLDRLPEGISARGTSRSAVSRRFVEGTQKRLEELLTRDLTGVRYPVVFIDGIHFRDHVLLMAMGLDVHGNKRILGVWDGATENSTACKAMLVDLIERGFDVTEPILAVIDGSKALRRALRDVFGNRHLVQRCQEHKKRNVLDLLPKKMRPAIRRALNEAYRSTNAERAKRLLSNLARRLERDYRGAAASLREGMDETLTVLRLKLSPLLRRSLCTTNIIENAFSYVRAAARRVKRWRGATMILRWVCTSLLEAEGRFKRIRGYQDIPKLITSLREAVDGQSKATVDASRKAA